MILLDLDPNIVKPGWTPFLITIGLAAIMYLLFRSMRRQFRRVDVNYFGEEPPVAEPVTVPPTVDGGSTVAPSSADGEPRPQPPLA